MRSLFFLVSLLFFQAALTAQNVFNCNQIGQKTYPVRLSDIWGYVDNSGTEYALVGVHDGVSIVSLSDPTNPTEIQFINGGTTIWRDLKTWNNHMYVCSEIVGEGLLIADLSSLPNATTNYQYVYLTVGTDTLRNAHNIYIDENGYLYVTGSDLANGAPIIFDLTNPFSPNYLGTVGTEYAHDIYVRGDTLWGANVYVGEFSVYDVSNKANPQLLATQTTSRLFTHNCWISDDGNTLFTTDERAEAYIDAYDVSDLSDIQLLDKWRPENSIDQQVIPHNVHVFNDYLVTSHYTEGLTIVDAKHPDNLVLVGQFDSYTGNSQGFFGCWGAYPFLPSGNIIISDINTGLYVLNPNYLRACRLEGLVRDQSTSSPIFDALVEIETTNNQTNSELSGIYKTGYHQAGNYDVTYRKAGYIPQTVNVDLYNDSIVNQDVNLQTAIPFNYSGIVRDINTANGIPQAKVRYLQTAGFYQADTFTNAFGQFDFNNILEEEYDFIAGFWGYKTKAERQYVNSSSSAVVIELDSGYYDDFSLDFNWTVSGNMQNGGWERNVPNQVYQWSGMMPKNDLLNDFGKSCFITGVDDSRSDAGTSSLLSPTFDGLSINDPHLSFYYWLTSFDSTYAVNQDSLELWIHNGTNSVQIDYYKNGLYRWSDQQIYRLADFIQLSNNMQIEFIIHNSNNRNFKEAAVDKIRIDNYASITNVENTPELAENSVSLQAYPIPFREEVIVDYKIPNILSDSKLYLNIYNLYGQLIESHPIPQNSTQMTMGRDLPQGVYILQLGDQTTKIVKQP
jgi:choice-of-anchor B domain-containing protein